MGDTFMSMIGGNATMCPLNNEFDMITDKFCASLGTHDVCVSAIYKINNPSLEARFEARKQAIAAARNKPPDVVDVFHGTSLMGAANIVNTGFDPNYSTIAAYGKGTYASPSVKTALHYCKGVKKGMKKGTSEFSMVFLCRFLKGELGSTGGGVAIDTTKMDYCGGGDILVTPYADGIIPDYLLCYYRM